MKTIFKPFTIILKILVVLIVIFVIGAIALSFIIRQNVDDTSKEIIENDHSIDEVIEKNAYLALKDTANEEKISLDLNEYNINELLYAVFNNMSLGPIKVKSSYVKLNDTSYNIYFPVKAYGVNSLISGELRMDANNDRVSVYIENLKIGKLKITDSFITKVLILSNLNKRIEKLAKNYYLDFETNNGNICASLLYNNISNLLDKVFADEPVGSLIKALANLLIVETDSFSLQVNNPLSLNVTVDLSVFGGTIDSLFAESKNDTLLLLDNNVISTSDLKIAMNYYVKSYNYLTDEEKTTLNEVPNSSSFVNLTYPGAIERKEVVLSEVLASQVGDSISLSNFGFKIEDLTINAMLSNLTAIGSTLTFYNYEENDLAYFVLQKMSVEINDNQVQMMVSFNINGFNLPLMITLNSNENKGVAIKALLSNITIGRNNYLLSETDNQDVLIYLESVVDTAWFIVNAEEMNFTFDFSQAFNENIITRNLLQKATKTSTSFKKHVTPSGDSNGYILIKITL